MTLRTESIEYQHNGIVLEGLLAWDDAQEGAKSFAEKRPPNFKGC